MKYAVKVKEILSRTFVVEADTYEDAENKVADAKHSNDIILDCDDFSEDEIGPSETFGTNPIDKNDERLKLFAEIK